MTDIGIIGAGSWGTTLANLLAKKEHSVMLWVHEADIVAEINSKHTNKTFCPDVTLSDNITASHDIKEVVSDKEIIVSAVPTQFLRATTQSYKEHISDEAIVVSVSKGLEEGSNNRMTEIISEELGNPIVSLSGPNHAEEVAKEIPTATVIASDSDVLGKVKETFETDYFKVYPHDDVVGVELCGAIKNVTAIAVGIADGLNLGDNAKGALITLGLTEMATVGRHYGAKRSTFYGLAGVGDLVATCTSQHSRNRFVGQKIAEGLGFDEIKAEMKGMVAEGIKGTKAIYDLSVAENLDLPLTHQVYKVLYEKKEIKTAIKDLITLI